MRFFWTFRSLPELNHLTDDEKSQVIQAAAPWRARVAIVGRCVLWGVLVGGVFTGSFVQGIGVAAGIVCGIGLALLMGAAAYQSYMVGIRRSLRRFLFESHRGRKLPVCLRCGYDLTGNETEICPECGANVVMPKK